MTMRFLTTALTLCGAFVLAVPLHAAEPARRPNIVFILVDDMGYSDLGCYGCPDIKTPNIDRLAREGVRLTDCYSNGCVCTPTRCAFMTGRYQQRIGGLEFALNSGVPRLGLPPQEKTIARLLKDSGYATALSGKWHLGFKEEMAPNNHGFERFFGLLGGNHEYFVHKMRGGKPDLYLDTKPIVMKGYSTHLITDHALKFLDAMKEKPFFLYVAYNAPHWPYQGPTDNKVVVTYEKWLDGNRATYVKMVESLDEGIGKLLDALKKHGLEENTLVVFTNDNGGEEFSRNAPFSKGKGSLWEGGIRVPGIARWPGKLPAGKVSNQAGLTMDWSATFLKAAGVQPLKDRPFDGIDLLPILSGKEPVKQRQLYWRNVGRHANKLQRAVRDGDWKYIDEPSGKEFLYDLSRDPAEKDNLAAKNRDRAAAMKKLLDRWEADVDPPLYKQSGDQRIK